MTVTAGNTLECFFKSCYQNPQTDFFRAGTSFMCVDKDLWQLQLFLPNTTVTRCNTLACFFKNCYQSPETDIFRVEPVLCVFIKNFDSCSSFFQTQQWQDVILLHVFSKIGYQNPQTDFFRVWSSFMVVDKDLWKLKLFLPNTTVTKCYICEWIFKSYLIKIHKVTSLEYEPVLWVLIKIFES